MNESAAVFRLSPEGQLLKEICEEEKLTDVFRAVNSSGTDFTRFDSKTKTCSDDMPTEFYQLFIDEIINLLTSMYNDGLHSGCMGDTFYEGVLCLLYKKGDESNIDNYI